MADNDNNKNLEQLARLAGIESQYWDIWGNLHRIGDGAKASILAALGVPADSDAAVAAGLAALEQANWSQPLPPVLVSRLGEAIALPLVRRAEQSGEPVHCRILEEGGNGHYFTVTPSSGTLLAELDLDGRRQRWQVTLPLALPLGYHDFFLGDEARTRLIVAPERCYLPEPIAGGARQWGVSTHLYSLRRDGDWGIGDFTGLVDLVEVAASLGATVIGLNPLHTLFAQHPDRASPYSPSSRLFLNPLYIDIEAVPEYADSRPAQRLAKKAAKELAVLRAKPFVDYPAVAALKQPIFRALYQSFHDRHLTADKEDERANAFRAFVREGGEPLRRFALFEVLSAEFGGTSWTQWPEAYRRCDGPAVAEFAKARREDVELIEYLQWRADLQLAAAQERAHALGLPIGLYRDLAVGAAADGADAWIAQDVIVNSATVGCPPDPFNMLGQDWGTPPLHPHTLREQGYEAFANILRANMRHAGALRIDHVMGLMHLFWIPKGGKPDGGAYIEYPFEDLLAVLALESHRNRCLVVGEDLGTVPAGFRERMAAASVLSYRVLYFEKDGDRFKRPDEYPGLALACVTTHDLATLSGFWSEADIDLKHELNLYPDATAERGERSAREDDRQQLLAALDRQGLLSRTARQDAAASGMSPALAAAIHEYLARSPVRLLLVQLDDLTEEGEQLNLPGTDTERPNWRRRLHLKIKDIAEAPVVRALVAGLEERSQTIGPSQP